MNWNYLANTSKGVTEMILKLTAPTSNGKSLSFSFKIITDSDKINIKKYLSLQQISDKELKIACAKIDVVTLTPQG